MARCCPQVGIQWGAGGDTPAAELAAEGTLDAAWAIRCARACLDAGAQLVMVESEGSLQQCSTSTARPVAALKFPAMQRHGHALPFNGSGCRHH